MIVRWLTSLSRKLRRPAPGRSTPAGRRPARPALGVELLETRDVPTALPPGFIDTTVAAGFDFPPTAMEFAPDGRLFVSQKDGKISIVQNGTVLPTPFLQLPTISNTTDELGLEGFTLDPNFESNGFVYVYYTVIAPHPFNRISRFQVLPGNPNLANPSSETVILDRIPVHDGFHQGGSMHFGPDGKLYVGIGDTDVEGLAQSLHSLAGKILRLDPDNYPFVVPRDNPFVHVPGARKEIYAYGFRNPFTSAITLGPHGVMLFVNDVGADTWEEVDSVRGGRNYGWPVVEGPGHVPGMVNPIYAYHHDRGMIREASVTGGVFYTGTAFPSQYWGKYFFSDYNAAFIRVLDPAHPRRVLGFALQARTPIDLDVGPDGGLYYLSLNDKTVHEIRFVGF